MNDTRKTTGAMMVVGAGIGGMQAALDAANAGYKVYLVEETTAIGGRMAQLDKTFPTNDCAMCTISPRLIEVSKHNNIEIITNAQVQGIEGEAGNFTVEVLKSPRYIDLVKCNACGDCIDVCPVELPNDFDENLVPRKAVYKRYPQAIPNAFAIEKKGVAPCQATCPSHVHAQGYIALIAKKKYREALELVRQDNPFPSICGRVCTHPCEGACTRKDLDTAVAINSLKRFVADKERGYLEEWKPEIPEGHDERIAIVGGGPAGLTAAYYLALAGYKSTVFEALPVAGGMLSVGIPTYRLPRDVIQAEIDVITRLGVEIRTGVRIGENKTIDGLFGEGFKAVFVGVGAHKSRKLGIPGEDLEGLVHGVNFLRDLNLGKEVEVGERVAVVGGGNVAIDAVRSAIRLGAKEAFILYRRSREEMPADDMEIEEAEEEGIKLHFLTAPVEILGEGGKVKGVKCLKMELGEPDASGRRRPVPIEGSEFVVDVDMIIPAIGQSVDTAFSSEADGIALSKWGTVDADPTTMETSRPGVFSGGDAVLGPATVIEAIAAGKEAAISIERYLKGEDVKAGRKRDFPEFDIDLEGRPRVKRHKMPALTVADRVTNWDEVQLGFSEDDALAEAERCLNCSICSECLQCVVACSPKAVVHDQQPETVSLNVGSLVLTPGFELFKAAKKGEYGYGRMPNVLTGLEFERILSTSGPFQGEILRPSDSHHPKKIAWIQCVGSRDTTCGNDYCSSVCCMYATKEAIIAKEHEPDIEATIFYNDLRAFGKGFEFYYESAKNNAGIRYARGIVSTVKELQQSKNLQLTYSADGEMKTEEFDMVVLSTGLVPSESTRALAGNLGIETDRFGFCKTGTFTPNETSKPGVFVAGVFKSPMDIPETVIGSSGAVAQAAELLADSRGTLVESAAFPAERNVENEEPRIGVFVCHCGSNIARVVDVKAVAEYAKSFPEVVHAENNLYTCSTDSTKHIAEVVIEKGLNRVVVASCTPKTHEPLFRDTLKEAGLNKYLFEMANIRDQCSWVHAADHAESTEKARDLVRMAISRARYLEPIEEHSVPIVPRALVVGGGLAGMTAARSLANQGFETVLVEREEALGGNLRNLRYTIDGDDPAACLDENIRAVGDHPKIELLLNAQVTELAGHVGSFTTKINTPEGDKEVRHGALIVATGAEEYKPTEYGYGTAPGILTQTELEEKIAGEDAFLDDKKSVVMIQCVGSREPDHNYCSRICCGEAVKNAIRIKRESPETEVTILYRDIRTYGHHELHYQKARNLGVLFMLFDADRKPEVEAKNGTLTVRLHEEVLDRDIEIGADVVALSAAIRPMPGSEKLAKTLKVNRNVDGFFLEAHLKLRPLDFATDGMYLCGIAHSPKLTNETIEQARGAAARAATILSKESLSIRGEVSVVEPERCVACLTCVRVCPYDVPKINTEGVAEIEAAMCQGCGICASACPRKAIQLQHYKDEQVLAKCDAILDHTPKKAAAGGQES